MESGVVDMYFAFWQYSPVSPMRERAERGDGHQRAGLELLRERLAADGLQRPVVSYYTPYYYQAAYQLGSPEPLRPGSATC